MVRCWVGWGVGRLGRELHEHLNSSLFPESFGTIENPTLVSAILDDGVVGCGGGTGDAERVPQQFHGKEGFLDRCGECEQIFMLAHVTHGLCLAMRHETELETYELE